MNTSAFPQLNDRDWLLEQYSHRNRSAQSIADEVGTTKSTVLAALRRHGIAIRKRTRRTPLDVEEVRRLYLDEGLSMPQISKRFNTSVGNVAVHLQDAGVTTRSVREGLRRDADGRVVRRPSETRAESIRRAVAEKKTRGYRLHGPASSRWKGGRVVLKSGYVRLYAPEHPRSTPQNPYVSEHILVAEKTLGRYLQPDEHVHHVNHVKGDNRPENLVVKKRGQHTRDHFAEARELQVVVQRRNERITYLERILDEHGIAYEKES